MSTTTAPTLASPTKRSQGIALRRGIVLVLMSAILPWSAQLATGRHRLGRVALRVWLAILGLLTLLGLALLLLRNQTIGLLASPLTLTILGWGIAVLAGFWVLLLADAWLSARPQGMSLAGKLVSGGLALALIFSGGTVAWSASTMLRSQAGLVDTVFAGGGDSQTVAGRLNVLLLGGDAGADRQGLRPDSITVASIDADTGRTVLFSLPRNMQHVPFPADSPLHAKYPNGYFCHVENLADACMLNGIYTLGVQNKKLFKGAKYPGVEATKQAVEATLGLKINYWAMIDLKGFQKLIDAVGGIRMDINKKVPIGSLHGPKGVYDWIKPGKNVHLDGFHALWFARSREYSTDYERMQRQKCVMNAMLKQLNPTTVLTKFQDIADAGKQIVATNVPSDQLGVLLDLALKGKSLPMSSVSFTPPLIVPMDPDFTRIQSIVADRIADSEALDAQVNNPRPEASPTGSASPKPKKKGSNQNDDLDLVCKASA